MTASETFGPALLVRLGTMLPSDRKPAGEDARAKKFILWCGLRAFGRPLTAEENPTFTTLYTTGRAGGAFPDGIELVIQAMLQSADFLYRVEATDPTATPTATAPVGPFEMATRLSYFPWGTMPDKTLLDAAGANQLGTKTELEAQVRRMLTDAKTKASVASFHGEWLGTSAILALDT